MNLLDSLVKWILEVGTKRKRNTKDWFSFIRSARLRWYIRPKEMADQDGYIQASKELSDFFQNVRQTFGLKETFL